MKRLGNLSSTTEFWKILIIGYGPVQLGLSLRLRPRKLTSFNHTSCPTVYVIGLML